jgi:hypothetical protein
MASSHSSYVRTSPLCYFALLFITLFPVTAVAAAGAPKPSVANRTDAQIDSDFRMRLGRSKLAGEGIQIRVKGGVATLTGKTNVIQHKGSATRMAKSAGAHQVVNQIEISAAARELAAAKMAANVNRSNTLPSKPAVTGHAASTSAPPNSGGTTAASAATPAASSPAPPPVRRAQIQH